MKKILIISLVVVAIIINCVFLFNESFYKTTYRGIFIPKYSFLVRSGGCECATFYSLKSKEKLENEINENIKYNTIKYFIYKVIDSGFYRTIAVEFDPFS